jgi:hypothetical protein
MKTIRKKARNAFQKFMKELNEYSEVYAKMHTRDFSEKR